MRPEPSTAVNTVSIIDSEPQARARSVTPTAISSDALSEEPIFLKECVLRNRHAFMLRTMASAKANGMARAWSREECVVEREVKSFMDEHVRVLTRCSDHLFQRICEQNYENLCCPLSQPEMMLVCVSECDISPG